MSIGEVEKVFLQIDSVLTEMLSCKQAAYRYNFSQRTFQQWCDEGKLKAVDFEGRWFIPIAEIERHVSTRDHYHKVMGQFE